jgi:ABC-type Fe3+/spermidine/putrescine transport system ATPase subunit
VTHDQNEAMAVADRVAVLYEGRLQQFGSPREVYVQPANRFVADFMGTINLVSGRLAESNGSGATVRLLDQPQLEIRLPVAQPPATATVTLAIRPEDVVLEAPGSGVAATIEQATFLGNLNDYIVAVGGDGPAAPLRLRVQAPARSSFGEGQAIGLRIDGDRCVLVE